MRLRYELPADVAAELAAHLDGGEVHAAPSVRYAVPADLTADGTFGRGWTVATDAAVAVQAPGARGWRILPLRQVRRFRADNMVGSGRLIAEPVTDGNNGATDMARS